MTAVEKEKRKVRRIEPGQRYGRLTVVAKTDRRVSDRVVWECRCDCGNTTYVTSSHLASGSTISCGCAKTGTNLLDLSGQRFGRLTVLRRTDRHMGNSVIWECRCDCGNTAYVASTNLRKGYTKSCGCLSSEIHRESFRPVRAKRAMDYIDGTDVKGLLQEPGKSNTSGTVGVSYDRSVRLWKAEITFKGRNYYLGSSREKDIAVAIRKEAEQHIHGKFLEWYYQEFPERKPKKSKRRRGTPQEV